MLVRIQNYLSRWLELPQDDYVARPADFSNLMVEQEFIRACPKELAIYLGEQERNLGLEKLTKTVDKYLEAHT